MNKVSENIDVGVKIDIPCVKLQSHCKVIKYSCITLEVNNFIEKFIYAKIHRSPDLKHFLFARNGVILFLKQTITLLT